MNSKYWQKNNSKKKKLIKKIIGFNRKNKVNFFEDKHFNHTRDILALAITLSKRKGAKFEVLDYGSNPLSIVNLTNKINLRDINFTIYDPFINLKTKKIKIKKIKYKEIKKEKNINYKKFNFIHYGSSIQYIENFFTYLKYVNLNNTKYLMITHTPFSMKRSYKTKQSNHLNLEQNVYSLLELKKILVKKKFKVVFMSRNSDQYKACKIEKFKTYSLNILFSK